jgi:hypothetical protein
VAQLPHSDFKTSSPVRIRYIFRSVASSFTLFCHTSGATHLVQDRKEQDSVPWRWRVDPQQIPTASADALPTPSGQAHEVHPSSCADVLLDGLETTVGRSTPPCNDFLLQGHYLRNAVTQLSDCYAFVRFSTRSAASSKLTSGRRQSFMGNRNRADSIPFSGGGSANEDGAENQGVDPSAIPQIDSNATPPTGDVSVGVPR